MGEEQLCNSNHNILRLNIPEGVMQIQKNPMQLQLT